jgi:alkylation response protein AidB-like acyl-CoA dehydrogenase/predicted TIM-barrel fold metal-dependent hydrolase
MKGTAVNRQDMILVSVDDHIIEPPDMFVNHLPERYKQDAPRLVHRDDGTDVWTFRDTVIPNAALNAVAGRPRSEYGMEPQGLDEIRPGCYDVHERVKDMNAGGVLASMNFPSFPGFAARLFATEDADFSLALVRAYNDWHLDEWCGAYPGRFIPMALPAIWDAELCAAEVRRVAAKGCHSLTFTENPATLGYPSFHDPFWNPLGRALCDTGTVLSVHIGSSGRLTIPAVDSPPDVMITLQPMNIVSAAADLLWSRPVKEYPDLRIALSEGGTGWIPYFLERVDRTFEMHSTWTLQDFGGKLPSEVFREHFLTCFISDPLGVRLRHDIGIDNICWEADYPHSDSMWPGAPEELGLVLERCAVPDDEIDKMTHLNAMRWYSFDPFAHVPREQATVGALRRAAAGHDVEIRSRSHRVVTPSEKLEGYRRRPADADIETGRGVDFELTEDQRTIRKAVATLVRTFDDRYWLERDRAHEFPAEFYDAIAAGGWLGLTIPEEYGGHGFGITEATLLMEEVARSGGGMNAASSIHLAIFGMQPVVVHGSEELKRRTLPRVAAGDLHVCFGVTEPGAGLDTSRISTFARRDGDRYLVNGRKVWISKAAESEKILLLTRTTRYDDVARKTDGMTLFLTDLDRDRVEVRPIPKMGRNAVTSTELYIDDLEVPVEDRVGEEGQGFRYLLDGLNPERMLIAAEALGIGRVALDRAVRYGTERVVFGRPIGMNQAVQFPLADSLAHLDAAELVLRKATWLYDQGRPCGREANTAKYLCADAGFTAADRALQTHGGMGYAEEYHVARYFREARLLRIAPISQEMILNYLGSHTLGLPRSY